MEVSKKELEDIIDEKVEKRLRQRKRGTAREAEDQIETPDEESDSSLSRRGFLKTMAGGAVGLGAAAMIGNASAFRINSDQGLSYFNRSSNQSQFNVSPDGVLDAKQIGTIKNPVESFHSERVNTDELFSRSKRALVVVWTDGSTVYADGPDSQIASGSDATTVLQSALDFANTNGLKTHVTEGTYQISSPLQMYSQEVEGAGRGNTMIELTDSTQSSVVEIVDTYSQEIQFSNLHLKGAGRTAGTNVHGLYSNANSIKNVYNADFHHLNITDVSGDGVHFDVGFSFVLRNYSFSDLGGWGYNGDAGPGVAFRDWQFPCRNATGGLWVWNNNPTVDTLNLGGGLTYGLRFGNSATGDYCFPSVQNVNIEPFTDTGIEFYDISSPCTLENVHMYVADGATAEAGVDFGTVSSKTIIIGPNVSMVTKGTGTYSVELAASNTQFQSAGGVISLGEENFDMDPVLANKAVHLSVPKTGFETPTLAVSGVKGSSIKTDNAAPTNLSRTIGAFDGEQRPDDGTNTAARGVLCVWDDTASVWVKPDGTTFS